MNIASKSLMKSSLTAFFAGISCLAVAPVVRAQSNVSLYGVIDASVRYTSNVKGANGVGDTYAMTSGGIQGSRWGIKGGEDLGDGTKAMFTLESGFVPSDGTFDQQGQLFGRQTWVGLANPTWGRLLFGRIYGIPFGLLSDFDALGIGNYIENAYLPRIIGVRYDNTVDYSISRGAFTVELQHGFGNQAGSTAVGSTNAIGLTFNQAGLEIGVLAHQSRDVASRKLTIIGGGAKYDFGPATVYAMYLNARRDAGFSPGSSVGQPLANTSLLANTNTVLGSGTQTAARVDAYVSLGMTYRFSPAWTLSAGAMMDNVRNLNGGDSGKIRTTYALVDYALSKRTDVYATVDRNWLSGGSVTDPNSPIFTFGGRSTRTGAGLGMRHRF